MNIATAFWICMFRKYATFSGTASRSEFWWFILVAWIFNMIVGLLANDHSAFSILNLAVLIPSLAVGSRRLHDVGHTGWWQLLYLLPFLGPLLLIFGFFIRQSNPRSAYAAPSPSTSWSAYDGHDSSSMHPDGEAASRQSGSGADGYGSRPFQESPSTSGAAGSPRRDTGTDRYPVFASSLFQGSLDIDSLSGAVGHPVEIIAMLRNRQLIYLNTANSYRYVMDYDGWKSFTGPAFKIILTLATGDVFNIFYGVVTADRKGFIMGVTPELLDGFTVTILKELTAKCPGIFDLRQFVSAPTQYTYHLYQGNSFYYLTTNRGNDAFCIHFSGRDIVQGDRDTVLSHIRNLNRQT